MLIFNTAFSEILWPGKLRLSEVEQEECKRLLFNNILEIPIGAIKLGTPWRFDMLPDVLSLMRENACTDDRDRVYGILGLLGKDTIPFNVSYKKSVEEVYIEAVQTYVEKVGKLTILSFAERELRSSFDSSTPSWCPDWRNGCDTKLLQFCVRQEPLSQDMNMTLYSATKNNIVRARFCNMPPSLKIEGMPIASIIWCSKLLQDLYRTSDNQHLDHAKLKDRILEIQSEFLEHQKIDRDTIISTLLTTILADQWYTETSRIALRLKDHPERLPGYSPHTESDEASLLKALKNTPYRAACDSRRVLVTDTYPYLALGPRHAREGDDICALSGGDALYVLGERQGLLRWIGEWWVSHFFQVILHYNMMLRRGSERTNTKIARTIIFDDYGTACVSPFQIITHVICFLC